MYPENNNNEYNFKEYQKHKSHEKQCQHNSEVNNNILKVQQDTNENIETINETEIYDKNSVRKGIINLKNDTQEIKEALRSILTKQGQSKYEQEVPYQPMGKEIKGTRQHIKGNNQKEIDSNQQKKVNRTKLKKEILSNDMTLENRENKDKPEQPSEKQKNV